MLTSSELHASAKTTLAELTEAVEHRLPALRQHFLPAEQVGLGPDGWMCLGSRTLQLAPAAWAALAGYVGLPAGALLSLEGEERAFVMNRRVLLGLASNMPTRLRLMIDDRRESIVGIADARLVQVGIRDLLSAVIETLPRGLEPDEVRVGSFVEEASIVTLKLYAPGIKSEPIPGDVVHGGIAISYSVTGDNATQVLGYTRRLACENEALCHVCSSGKKKRTRRRLGSEHQLENLLVQVRRLLSLAWEQTRQKLDALQELLREEGDPEALLEKFVEANRKQLSLNKKTVEALKKALGDEPTLTGTAYDVWNALSRVATHGAPSLMNPRQRMNLFRAAGELAQRRVHQCDSCGTWLKAHRQENPKMETE